MANLLSAEKISLALGTQQLLDSVSLGIGGGERIGIVGRNGGGKSTLLKVLAGVHEVDSGRLTMANGVTVGMLTQADTIPAEWTVLQAVVGDRAEHEWAGEARIREVINGLLPGMDLHDVVGPKSGGERRRIALAKLLVDDPDLLLLDEPTNHLDVEGVQWLADFLNARRTRSDSALVTITHDRWFLDATSTNTWEVIDGRVEQYEGGYAAFVLAKAERARIAAATEERRQNLLRKELAWLQRGAPARTSKPKFRIDAANALIANEPDPRNDVELVRFATTRLGKDVIDIEGASVTFGDSAVAEIITGARNSTANAAAIARAARAPRWPARRSPRPRGARCRTGRARCSSARGRRRWPTGWGGRRGCSSPTPRCATGTSRCWQPGCGRST